MSKIKLTGDSSGYVEISAPSAAGNNTLELPASGSKIVVSDSSDNVNIAGNITATNYTGKVNDLNYPTAGSLSGARNRIINGDMRIDQRNNGASVTPTTDGGSFPVDRWLTRLSQTSKYSVQQNSSIAPAGFTHSLAVTSLSAYSIGAGDYFALEHRVEGFNISDLAWGTSSASSARLSFWVRSSLTGTFGGAIVNGSLTPSYPFTYSITAANTWEYKTISISGPTSGVWNSSNGRGLSVIIGLGVGSSLSFGTAGAWSSSTLFSAPGATSVVGTNGATFYITGVQLEAGTAATPFERRSYGQELSLCERYYELCAGGGYFNSSTNGTFWGSVCNFRVQKRATPTITRISNIALANALGNPYSEAISINGFRSMCQASAANLNWQTTYSAEIEL